MDLAARRWGAAGGAGAEVRPRRLPRLQVVTTISRGRVVWHGGVLDVTAGTGRLIPMPSHGPLFEGLDLADKAQFDWGYGPQCRPPPAADVRDEL